MKLPVPAAAAKYAASQPVQIAIGAVILLAGVYFVLRKGAKDTADAALNAGKAVAGAAAGVVTGNNIVTQNQTNFDGEKVDAYEGRGVFGTLGGVFNSVSGGLFASIGEGVSSWFAPSVPDGFLTDYIVTFPDGIKHAVNAAAIDKNSYFMYGGKKYRLGISNTGTKVAVAA